MRKHSAICAAFILAGFSIRAQGSAPSSTIDAGLFREGAVVTAGGFRVTLAGVSKDGSNAKAATATVDMPEGMTPASVAFAGLEAGSAGVTAYPRAKGDFRISSKGWIMRFSELTLADTGLRGSGFLVLPASLGGGEIEFPGASVDARGVLASGAASPEASVSLSGCTLLLARASLAAAGNGYLLSADAAVLPVGSGGKELPVGSIAFGPDGRAAAPAEGPVSAVFDSSNGYRVGVDRFRVDEKGAWFSGSLAFPKWAGSGAIAYKDLSLRLSGGNVSARDPVPRAVFRRGDWTIVASGVLIGNDKITCASATAAFGKSEVEIGSPAFGSDGSLLADGAWSGNRRIPAYGGRMSLLETRFGEQGLSARAVVLLPDSMGGSAIEFGGVEFFPDGSFGLSDTVPKVDAEAFGVKASFEDVWLADDELKAGAVALTLPDSAGKGTVRLGNATVGADGSVALSDASSDAFRLWGMDANVRSLSFGRSSLAMRVDLALPETIGTDLAGKRLADARLEIGKAGAVLAFDGLQRFEPETLHAGKLPFTATGIRAVYENGPKFRLENPVLEIRFGTAVTKLRFKDMRFDPVAGSWDFGYAKALDYPRIFRPDFVLEFGITGITGDSGIMVQGSIHLAKDGKFGSLGGRSYPLTRFALDEQGKIDAIDFGETDLGDEGKALIEAAIMGR